jgi:hypothetical protein
MLKMAIINCAHTKEYDECLGNGKQTISWSNWIAIGFKAQPMDRKCLPVFCLMIETMKCMAKHNCGNQELRRK